MKRRYLILVFLSCLFVASQANAQQANPRASNQETQTHAQSSDAVDRLVFTIIGGAVVALLGIFIRREADIHALANLAEVLKHQISAIVGSAHPLDHLIPVGVDDLKPLARYMRSEDFILVMQAAAISTQFSELAAESIRTKPQDTEKRQQIEAEMSSMANHLRSLVKSRDGYFSVMALSHNTINLWKSSH